MDIFKIIKKKYNIIVKKEYFKYKKLLTELFVNDKDLKLNYLNDKNNNLKLNIYGLYYYCVKKDYDLMKKYFSIAIKNDHSDSMFNLGFYYKNTEKNYDLMKKYYLMAIKKYNEGAMCGLALYYRDIEKNYDLMKKYYLMGIKNNCCISMDNLNDYYNFEIIFNKHKRLEYYKLIKKNKLFNYKIFYDNHLNYYKKLSLKYSKKINRINYFDIIIKIDN